MVWSDCNSHHVRMMVMKLCYAFSIPVFGWSDLNTGIDQSALA